MTYTNYDNDYKKSLEAEEELMNILKKEVRNFHSIKKVPPLSEGGYPYDLKLLTEDKKTGLLKHLNIEVKSEAAKKVIPWGNGFQLEPYDTGCVEVFHDRTKEKRPEFFNDEVHLIAFKNRYDGIFYCYKAQEVIEYLKNWTGPLTFAKNKCESKNGAPLMKFYWEPEKAASSPFFDKANVLPGYLRSYKGKIDRSWEKWEVSDEN